MAFPYQLSTQVVPGDCVTLQNKLIIKQFYNFTKITRKACHGIAITIVLLHLTTSVVCSVSPSSSGRAGFTARHVRVSPLKEAFRLRRRIARDSLPSLHT